MGPATTGVRRARAAAGSPPKLSCGGGAKLAASGGRKPSPHESYEFKHPYLTIQLQCMNEPLLALLSPQQSNCGCHRTGSTACSCSDACCVRRIGSEATLLKATSLIASGECRKRWLGVGYRKRKRRGCWLSSPEGPFGSEPREGPHQGCSKNQHR